MRDNFKQSIINEIAKRVSYLCSNPICLRQTAGPSGGDGAINMGVAAHITAASPGGPRYNSDLTPEERSSASNAIWLCQQCSRLIDTDTISYPEYTLREWKDTAQARAYLNLHGYDVVPKRNFEKLEKKLPELIQEMRKDLKKNTFVREFILISKNLLYSRAPHKQVFYYYFECHEHLQNKVKICENYGAVIETTYNNVARYEFTEDFVEYLTQTPL